MLQFGQDVFLMALFKTRSAAVYGIDANLIDVEVDVYSSGSARDFIMVGMPDTAVRESRERIKAALLDSGLGCALRMARSKLSSAPKCAAGEIDCNTYSSAAKKRGAVNI